MTSSTPAERQPQSVTTPVDASIQLLKALSEESVDPDYAAVTRPPLSKTGRASLLVIAVIAGMLIAAYGVVHWRNSPQTTKDRQALITRVQADSGYLAQLRQEHAGLKTDIEQLRRDLDSEPSLTEKLSLIEASSGYASMTGPGVVITITEPESAEKIIIDQDLRRLVNVMWEAGAEAISVNGHRVTSKTAIRDAGSAITVNYVSISTPYRVEVIGDQRSLPAAFAASDSGQWWELLRQRYGIDYQVTVVESITVPASSNPALIHAKANP